jgi:hypothetical protein
MKGTIVLEKLQRRLLDVEHLHSKLILLVGGTAEGRTALLEALHAGQLAAPLHLGIALANALAELPQRERHLLAANMLRSVTQSHAPSGPLLIDGIELLFDTSLKVNALDVLRRQSLARPVVAAWPGEWRNGRLTYATLGHPEHQDHAADGAIIFEI